MVILYIVSSFIGALILSLLFTPMFKRIALKVNLVDNPGERKKHLLTTPLMGGVAIYLAFAILLVTALIFWRPASADTVDMTIDWKTLFVLLITGGGLMTLTGLLDDILGLAPLTKILLHTTSALVIGIIFVLKGTMLNLFMTGSAVAWLAAPVTILWLVGITNSVNLLDHADGLAAGIGVIAAIFFAIINGLSGNMAVALVSAVLGGAVLGFLYFNYSPASIFMGDSGSNLLGFILGIIAVLGVYTYRVSDLVNPIREISILAPLLVLAIPLMDTIFVLLYRRNTKSPLFAADNNHIAHRLMRLGLSHREAVQVLLVIATLMGILALLLPTLALYQAILLLAHALGLSGLIFFFIKRAEMNTKKDDR